MSNKTTKVFVYGTLKEGRPLDRKVFADMRTNVEEATIVGSIFSLGPYPTIKLDDGGTVHGEVHTFDEKDFPKVLSIMDGIEGYNPSDPKSGLYNRHFLDATTSNGQTVKVWAYEHNGFSKNWRRLEDGLWEPGK